MTTKKPCTRCLLAEAGELDIAKAIAERISLIPDGDKADERTYRERLSVCEGCEHLNAGTCVKCGCYVELRAARKLSACPDTPSRW